MKFYYKKYTDGSDKYSVFSGSISHYSFGTYDAFSDDFIFDTQIKSQWAPDQLIELGEFLNNIYENHNK